MLFIIEFCGVTLTDWTKFTSYHWTLLHFFPSVRHVTKTALTVKLPPPPLYRHSYGLWLAALKKILTINEFWLVYSLSRVFKRFNQYLYSIIKVVILCLNIWDVHQFIGHCLIPFRSLSFIYFLYQHIIDSFPRILCR